MEGIVYIYSNLPAYRKDFFKMLDKQLQDIGIEMSVMYGTLTGKKVVLQDNSNDYRKLHFNSHSKKIGPFSFTIIEGLYKAFLKEKPRGMVISYMTTNITMLRLVIYCLTHHIPYATWRCGYNRDDYSSISNRIRSLLLRFVERRANYAITYGSFYKKKLIEKGLNPDKIIIAQNTIDIENIIEKNRDLHRSYSHDSTKVLFVGALIKKKNLESSIEAIKILIEEGYNIIFDIVGGGEMLEHLKNLVKEYHLEDKINIVGPKYGDEVRDYFRTHDIFLSAGLGGLAINEAMAYGLPIISTNADWTICDLIDGNGYYMEKYGDVDLQVKYLKEFIALTPGQKRKMSERSKDNILQRASLAQMVEKHKDVCLKLINEKKES